MIGIRAIGTHVPVDKVSNLERAESAGKDRDFVSNKIGFESLARRKPGTETSDLCVLAWEDLQKKTRIDRDQIDCVIVCTQNPDAHGLPHTAAVVHRKLGLEQSVAAFDVSLGCSGYVYGISLMKAFMEANGLRSGLLFTADPYSKIIDPEDWDTELLFGDAATVTWMTHDSVFSVRPAMFGSDGALGHSIQVAEKGGTLSMLGSNVFKFSMTVVPVQIQAYLRQQQLTMESIDLFLFHQGSRFIVENLARRMGLSGDKVPFEAAETGNTVSSTLPLMLSHRFEHPPARVLLCGFGVGLSWATVVLESQYNLEEQQ